MGREGGPETKAFRAFLYAVYFATDNKSLHEVVTIVSILQTWKLRLQGFKKLA